MLKHLTHDPHLNLSQVTFLTELPEPFIARRHARKDAQICRILNSQGCQQLDDALGVCMWYAG